MKDNKEFIKKLNEKPLKKGRFNKFIDWLIIFSLVLIALCLIFGTFLFKL